VCGSRAFFLALELKFELCICKQCLSCNKNAHQSSRSYCKPNRINSRMRINCRSFQKIAKRDSQISDVSSWRPQGRSMSELAGSCSCSALKTQPVSASREPIRVTFKATNSTQRLLAVSTTKDSVPRHRPRSLHAEASAAKSREGRRLQPETQCDAERVRSIEPCAFPLSFFRSHQPRIVNTQQIRHNVDAKTHSCCCTAQITHVQPAAQKRNDEQGKTAQPTSRSDKTEKPRSPPA